AMADAIEKARMAADSVGGIVETMIYGMPAGVGDPIFECLESQIASLVFGIPAVRGLEFGTGFAAAGMTGSTHNDVPVFKEKSIRFLTNHSGGIQGGISNGMPIVFRVAFKPTASIGQEQQTINLATMAGDRLIVKGRHDPCIVPRAVPVVEAAAAIAALDAMLSAGLFVAG
ncbi:MAG TPA: chorismate synthase, partial [Clostridiales bacterium]|nr:chorismate synthase [Clostridiales bacterium]